MVCRHIIYFKKFQCKNKMNRILSVLLLILVCAGAAADPMKGDGALSGKVTDKSSGEALIGVTIYFPELSRGTTTDIDGKYAIGDLPERKLNVEVRYIGHKTIVTSVDMATTTHLDFKLAESDATMQEVVVTGLTGNILKKDSPTPITVVGAAQLNATPSTNIIDAISKQPGVAQITTGSGISKPVIRGLGFNRVVVVNDGVRQEGNQWGGEHGIEIDPQSISSAEILKGPASLMYGSDAMAGVIIFHDEVLPAPGKVVANASTEYQTNNGLFDYSVNAKGNNGGVVWSGRWSDKMAHAYKNRSDQYVLGSQYRERAAEGLVGINRKWGYSRLTLDYYHLTPGMVEGERGYSHSYGKSLPFQQVHHYKAVAENTLFLGKGTLKAIMAYQQNRRQEFEVSPEEPGLDFMLHTVNYDVKYKLPITDKLNMATGIGGMWQRSLNKGSEYLIPAYQLFDIGAFATTTYNTGKWVLSGGMRVDNRHLHSFELEGLFDRFSRDFTGVTGSVGAVYNATENMTFRMNVARGFRAPNLGELASNGVHEGTVTYEIGNHSLRPEYSWQADLGWDYTSKMLTTSLAIFTNFIDNYIFTQKLDGVKTDGYDTYKYIQGDARLIGGEASVDFHPVDRLHWANTFSYVNSVQLHQPADSKYLPYTPAPRWTADIRYDIVRDGTTLNNAYAAVQMECNLRQNHYYALNGTETATPSYTLFNVLAGTDIRTNGKKRASIYLSCNNIFDRIYQSHLSRLKYLGVNPANGRTGIFNMGRNFTVKVMIPIEI